MAVFYGLFLFYTLRGKSSWNIVAQPTPPPPLAKIIFLFRVFAGVWCHSIPTSSHHSSYISVKAKTAARCTRTESQQVCREGCSATWSRIYILWETGRHCHETCSHFLQSRLLPNIERAHERVLCDAVHTQRISK